MLMKLRWEIDQLRKSLSAQTDQDAHLHAPAYHAFNCAVTAWHLADWVWQSIDAEGHAFILSKLAVAPTGKKDFGLFTRELMRRHRALHICRQLATGSKHKIVEMHPDPAVRAERAWDSEPMRVGSGVGSRLVSYSIRLSIRDGEESRPALEVFDDAAQTWDRLLREWGFMEPRFVGAKEAP
jgi:hypothetical protein